MIVNHEAREILLRLQPTLVFSFTAGPGHTIEQWWVERGGSRPSDVGTHHDRIGPGTSTSLVSTPYGGGPIPWLSVQDVEGQRGCYAGIEFSGFVRMALQADAAKTEDARVVRALLGLGKSDGEDLAYRTRLAPGAASRHRQRFWAATTAVWMTGPTAFAAGSSGIFAPRRRPISRCW